LTDNSRPTAPGPVRAVAAFEVHERVLLASAGEDRLVHVWDPATGVMRRELTGHTAPVQDLTSFTSPDGHPLLATAGHDRTVRIWDPATGDQLGEPLTGHTQPVLSVTAFTAPDGRPLLATAGHDRTVRIWDPQTA
ncbi:hypothetical protein ACWGIV_34480, partial [Streptomyces sp. NPDC054844]